MKRESFLAGLPANTDEFPFGNRRGLRTKIESQMSKLKKQKTDVQFLIFSHLLRQEYEKIGPRDVRHSTTSYNEDLALMVIKIPVNPAHDSASRNLASAITAKLVLMGLPWSALNSVGSATVRNQGSSKEADESWKPLAPPGGTPRLWPTVVAEVGLAESYARLKVDAQWWLEQSRGEVQLVILVNIDRVNMIVTIEEWVLGPSASATITRSLSGPRTVPTMIYRATMTKQPNNNVVVQNAPMTIPFQSFFLRPPTPPETDIILSGNDLIEIANNVFTSL